MMGGPLKAKREMIKKHKRFIFLGLGIFGALCGLGTSYYFTNFSWHFFKQGVKSKTQQPPQDNVVSSPKLENIDFVDIHSQEEFDAAASRNAENFRFEGDPSGLAQWIQTSQYCPLRLFINSTTEEISENCFKHCKLKNVWIRNASIVREGAFEECSLESVDFDEKIKVLGTDAFLSCKSLTSITLPSSLTSIGESAFFGCESLFQISIPSNVTSIGNWAFSNCPSLARITLPSSVTAIEGCTFLGCKGLKEINLPDSITKIGGSVFWMCKSLTQITLPSSVKSIGSAAFFECEGLTRIIIPFGVTSIRDEAFAGCKSLTRITLPSSVTSIEEAAFARCESLTQITLPSKVELKGELWFSGCDRLQKILVELESGEQEVSKDLHDKLVKCGFRWDANQNTERNAGTTDGGPSFHKVVVYTKQEQQPN